MVYLRVFWGLQEPQSSCRPCPGAGPRGTINGREGPQTGLEQPLPWTRPSDEPFGNLTPALTACSSTPVQIALPSLHPPVVLLVEGTDPRRPRAHATWGVICGADNRTEV